MRATVLVIDSDQGRLAHWARLLQGIVTLKGCGSFAAAWHLTDSAEWRAARHDRVLLSLDLPDGSGLDLLDRLRRLAPAPAVALLGGRLDARAVLRAHGRCALVTPPPTDRETLLGLLSVLDAARDGAARVRAFAHERRLSSQETKLLVLASRNATNDEAATELGCSPATVRSYWNRIFEKTGGRSARAVLTRLLNLTPDPPVLGV